MRRAPGSIQAVDHVGRIDCDVPTAALHLSADDPPRASPAGRPVVGSSDLTTTASSSA
jgi:hypothetical protein